MCVYLFYIIVEACSWYQKNAAKNTHTQDGRRGVAGCNSSPREVTAIFFAKKWIPKSHGYHGCNYFLWLVVWLPFLFSHILGC